MKLRIRGNSLRLRLGQSDVAQLASHGRADASIRFSADPESRLRYALVTSPDIKEICARLADGEIKVMVPEGMARAWANSEQVGLSHEQRIDGEEWLAILIEKDFQCLQSRAGDDQADGFKNPLKQNTHGSGS